MAAFTYTGLDPDDLTEDHANHMCEQMEAAYAQLDSRITAWWIVDKRRDASYPKSEFQNPTAERIDELYSKQFTSGRSYTLSYTFYMLYTGESGAAKFFDRVARIQAEDGYPLSKAVISAVKESLSGRAAFAKDVGVLRSNITAFERVISAFVSASPIKFERMMHEEFCRSLATLLNRASPPARHNSHPTARSWAVGCRDDRPRYDRSSGTAILHRVPRRIGLQANARGRRSKRPALLQLRFSARLQH